mmetsp:Transcript_9533/g.15822  ORF Transcript_9533/g.15822 Transcript_9533/m.15822 type:complete len:99 (+) Transcript_9533:55-351(+)
MLNETSVIGISVHFILIANDTQYVISLCESRLKSPRKHMTLHALRRFLMLSVVEGDFAQSRSNTSFVWTVSRNSQFNLRYVMCHRVASMQRSYCMTSG